MNATFICVVIVLVLTALLYVYLHHHGKKLTSLVNFFNDISKWFTDFKTELAKDFDTHKQAIEDGFSKLETGIKGKVGLIEDDVLKGHFAELIETRVKAVVDSFESKANTYLDDLKTELTKIKEDPAVQDKVKTVEDKANKSLQDIQNQAQTVLDGAKAHFEASIKTILENAVQSATAQITGAVKASVENAKAELTQPAVQDPVPAPVEEPKPADPAPEPQSAPAEPVVPVVPEPSKS